MKNVFKNLVATALSVIALAPFSVAALEKYLPNENTLVLAKIENFDKLEAQSQTNPLAAEFNTKIFTPLLNEAKANDKDGSFAKLSAECTKLSEFFSGEALVAVVGTKDACTPVLLVECVAGTDLEKIAAIYANKPGELKSVKIAGVPAKTNAEKTEGFAVVGNKFVFSDNVDALRRLIKAIKSEANTKEPKKKVRKFTDSAAFKKARKRIGDADFWIYADGKAIAKKLYASAENFDKEQAEEMRNNSGATMLSVMATPIVKAFAPEAIESIWSSAKFTADGAASDAAISWNANKGAVKLLTASIKDSLEKPTLFPPSDELASVASSNFSIGKFVLQFMSLAREATPMFALVEMQLMNLKATENLDVPAILAALDNGMASYSVSAGTPEDTVFALNVSDKKPVGFALGKIAEKLGCAVNLPADKKDSEIFCIASSEDGTPAVSAVFIGKKLCIGTSKMLEKIVAQATKGTKAPSVWDNANIKAGELQLPAGGYGISYAHLGKSITAMFAQAQESMTKTPSVGNEDGELIVDEDSAEKINTVLSKFKIGKNDFNYSVLSKTYLGEKEISAKTVIYKNK